MKSYQGRRYQSIPQVIVVGEFDNGVKDHVLNPRLDLRIRSRILDWMTPEGRAQTALAILSDLVGDYAAIKTYEKFADAFDVLPEEGFVVTARQVLRTWTKFVNKNQVVRLDVPDRPKPSNI